MIYDKAVLLGHTQVPHPRAMANTSKQYYSKQKQVPSKLRRDHLEWMQTARFIEEVERLERDGRVESRSELEERLLLPYNRITDMRAGRVRVPTSAIELLKREYNGDYRYVLLGIADPEHSGPMLGRRDLREGNEPYQYTYQTPAANLALRAGLPPKPRPAKAGAAGTEQA